MYNLCAYLQVTTYVHVYVPVHQRFSLKYNKDIIDSYFSVRHQVIMHVGRLLSMKEA